MVRPSGTEAPGARKCRQADVYDELRARVSSWPPLRLTRLRCERGYVVVVSPAAPVVRLTGGANATRNWYGYSPDLRGGGNLGDRDIATRGPGRHDSNRAGRVRQRTAVQRRSGHRSNRQLHGGITGSFAFRGAGDHRQPASGEGDRPSSCEDRQDRRRHAGEPACGGLPARDLDTGCRNGTAAQADGPPFSGHSAPDAASDSR